MKKVFEITPNYTKASDYYDGLEVEKGNIYKALVEEEYVTFYEFEIIKNGIKIRSIFKRFRDFISIQQVILCLIKGHIKVDEEHPNCL